MVSSVLTSGRKMRLRGLSLSLGALVEAREDGDVDYGFINNKHEKDIE